MKQFLNISFWFWLARCAPVMVLREIRHLVTRRWEVSEKTDLTESHSVFNDTNQGVKNSVGYQSSRQKV